MFAACLVHNDGMAVTPQKMSGDSEIQSQAIAPEELSSAAPSFTSVAPYYDKLMASVPYRFWLSYIEALWKTHGIKPRRVLDLACGTGTVSFLLAASGIDVVGVDISPKMIKAARAKQRKSGVGNVEFIIADASEMLPIRPSVDCAICLFDSLNNILDRDNLADAFRSVRESLADGGVFIFDLNTAYAFRQGMFNQRSSPLDEPLTYIWRSKFDEPRQLCTINMEFKILAHGDEPERRFTERHVQRAYSRVEVEDMLADAGFDDVTPYDAYSLFSPKKRSDRIFWVAR